MNRPVPADWTSDCESCDWFMKIYNREDLHLFQGVAWLAGQEHVMNNFGSVEVPGANEAYWRQWYA